LQTLSNTFKKRRHKTAIISAILHVGFFVNGLVLWGFVRSGWGRKCIKFWFAARFGGTFWLYFVCFGGGFKGLFDREGKERV
jgi:hypothetical protein